MNVARFQTLVRGTRGHSERRDCDGFERPHLRGSNRTPRRLVRCPACEDISVAQSNATAAIAVRHEIVVKVRHGDSDNQILTSLEATYGTSILLSPSTSGLGALLWIVPIGGLVLVVVTGLRLARRRSVVRDNTGTNYAEML